jgi:Zn-dependent protease
MRGGDPTAYHGGQVSLDPRPHIRREPFGMLVLPLLSVILIGWPFGYASTPYQPTWAAEYPKRAAIMALAGPVSNLLLVLVSALVIRIGIWMAVFDNPTAVGFGQVVVATNAGMWEGVAFVVSVFFSLNLLLAIFNLIPVPPLDGSGVVPLFLNSSNTSRYQRFIWGEPMLSWVGILVAWQLFPSVFRPVWLFLVNWILDGPGYG